MAHDNESEGQIFADFANDIGTLIDLITPNEGDEASVRLFGSSYTIKNVGEFKYNDEG